MLKNIKKLKNFQGKILFAESMKKHTTFKVGGNAEAFALADNEDSVILLLQELQQNNCPFFILGGGSNLVVSDLGVDGCVVSTEKLNSIKVIQEKDTLLLQCGAGVTIDELTQFCISHELTGLESFAGLPGTVGGALYMNARCYDVSISDVIQTVRFSTSDNYAETKTYNMNHQDWDYKKSPFQGINPSFLILEGRFKVSRGCKERIQEKCDFYISDRKNKGHFSHPSAGSVFKNNRDFGKPSGKIIDEAGLKGYTVGNAQIAPWHGNLIINLGAASADNIKEIVQHAQEVVQISTGKTLECEILFIGKFK